MPVHFVGKMKDRVTEHSAQSLVRRLRNCSTECGLDVQKLHGKHRARSSCAHLGRSPLLYAVTPAPHLPPPGAFQPFAPQCQQALLVDVLLLLPLTDAVTSHSPGSVSCEDEGWACLCDRDHWGRNGAGKGVTSPERGHIPGTQ